MMDPTLRDQIAQLRQALQATRESLVQAVMRRNRLQDEVGKQERILAELDRRLTRAVEANQPDTVRALRQERDLRAGALERAKAQAAQAEAETEAAKLRLPGEQEELMRRLRELETRIAPSSSAQGTPRGPITGEADSLWERATAKIDDLRREEAAREEIAGVGNRAVPTAAQETDRSAEVLLADLEHRIGLPPPSALPAIAPPANPSRASYLELDELPEQESPPDEPKSPPPQPAPPASVASPHPTSVAPPSPGPTVKPESMAPVTAVSSAPRRLTASKGEPGNMEPTQRVRVAAIGTGGIFRGAHLPCYPEIAQAQLVAFCDPDKTAQDLVLKRYHSLVEARISRAIEAKDTATVERLRRDMETIQICDDISEVIESVKPDLVDVCTQPLLHTPLSIQALEAGIHVMCEKPISRSWLESQRLIEAIARTGKFYQHNENWLFEPDYYTVKKLVDAGNIGELIAMFLTQAHGGPEGNPKFWDSDFGGGGSLLDNGIHAIGAAWYVAGLHKRPTLVKAAEPFGMSIRMPDRIIDGRYRQVTVDDDAHILIRFEDSVSNAWVTAHVEGSWSEQDSPDTVYIGTTGRIEMVNTEDGSRYAVIVDAHGGRRRFRVSGSNWQFWPSSFYGEILNMVECVRNNEQSIMTAQFGADCSAIVGAAYLSQKSGKRAVSLDEFRQFALDIAARTPDDPKAADDALVDALLSAVRQ